eukprot:Awhi_evm1s8957
MSNYSNDKQPLIDNSAVYPPQYPQQSYPPVQQQIHQSEQSYQQAAEAAVDQSYQQAAEAAVDVEHHHQHLQDVHFKDSPMTVYCPKCECEVVTSVNYDMGIFAWAAVAFFLFVTLGIFTCLPCCLPSFQDAVHSCSKCKTKLGRHK